MISVVITMIASFIRKNWLVAFYVLLIIACVLFAPDKEMKFIYTEF